MNNPIRYALNLEIPPVKDGIDYHDGLVLTGSCFTDHMTFRLNERFFSVFSQPCGVVFNPLSLADPFLRVLGASGDYDDNDLLHHGGIWHSKHHHGSFSEPGRPDVLRHANHMLHELKRKLHAARWLFVTFGTGWTYRLKDTGETVANCHKIPQSKFDKKLATSEEVTEVWERVISGLQEFNPQLRVVLTVSPVRHLRGGAVENNLGKAVLLLAVRTLCERFEHVSYFPSYELVTDDLRDYRFYEQDGAHPNPIAIEYVYEKFCAAYMNQETLAYVGDVDAYLRMSRHRLLREDGEEYIQFMKNLEQARENLRSKYDLEI